MPGIGDSNLVNGKWQRPDFSLPSVINTESTSRAGAQTPPTDIVLIKKMEGLESNIIIALAQLNSLVARMRTIEDSSPTSEDWGDW